MPIDGLASGLDTSTIISQLMQLERQPVNNLTARMNTAKSQLDAYGTVRTKLTALSTAARELSSVSGWGTRTATSSLPDVASVTAESGAALGNVSFTVNQLAASHGVVTATTVAARSSVIASGGTISITAGGQAHTLSVGSGTLDEVAAAINGAGIGISASAVNTGAGYRLQMNATASGAAAAFTVNSGFDIATAVTSQGADAQLTIGTGPGAYQVTSTSNVFSGVFQGLTVTAKSVSASPVTLTVATNSAAIADKMEALVKELNGALSEIKARTGYNAAANKGATLAGDTALRRVTQELTNAIIAPSAGGTAGANGVSLDRFGAVVFDRAKFTAAFDANPSGTSDVFAQSATTTGSVNFVTGGSKTVQGDYQVVVTQAAAQAVKAGMVGTLPVTVPFTISIKIGTVETVFATSIGQTAADVAAGLQAAATADGLAVTVSEDNLGLGIEVASTAYGSAATFDVAFDGVTWETATGTDIAGTIGGQAAVGKGQVLTVPSGGGDPAGLVVRVDGSATGNVGSLSYSAGIAQRLAAVVAEATDSVSGYMTGAENQRKSRVTLFENSIRGYEDRLVMREERLRKQYAALESALSSLQERGNYLTSQLSSLSNS